MVLLCVSAAAASQRGGQPAATVTGSGVIVGRVVDATNGRPITGAIVALGGRVPTQRVIVDEQGRFLFAGLPAGAFTIDATRAGYLPGAVGMDAPEGPSRAVDLADGGRTLDAVVRLWHVAAISGRVADDADDPIAGARVVVLRRVIQAGHAWFAPVGNRGASTDDRGQYRVSSLPPGRYLVATTAATISAPVAFAAEADAIRRAGGRAADAFSIETIEKGSGSPLFDLYENFPMTRVGDMLLVIDGPSVPIGSDDRTISLYSTTWHPAVPSPTDAAVVTLGAGDEREGVDVRLALTPTVRVSGTVNGPSGPVANLGLRLMPAGVDRVTEDRQFFAALTATAADGGFTFAGVHPGAYVLRAIVIPRPVVDSTTQAILVNKAPIVWVDTPVTVAETDLDGLAVVAHAGLRITGRVVFDGSSAKPQADGYRSLPVIVEASDGHTLASPRIQVEPDGTFYSGGLPAGRYFVRARTVGSWGLESAMVDGRDIADVPLALEAKDVDGVVLTFSDRRSSVAGTVRTPQGRPQPDAVVLVFPNDPANWIDIGNTPRRERLARVTSTGTYSLSGLPPGDYLAVAVNAALATDWQDPQFLQTIVHASSRLRVDAGQTTALNLTTVAIVGGSE